MEGDGVVDGAFEDGAGEGVWAAPVNPTRTINKPPIRRFMRPFAGVPKMKFEVL
jgi:hypothetical protein